MEKRPNLDVMSLYRAVGVDEFYSIMQTGHFSLNPDNAVNVKYFGVDYEETLAFASKIQFMDIVAVVEVGVLRDILLRIGDFTQVDTFLFKKGTVIIQAENLDEFNGAIKYIVQKY